MEFKGFEHSPSPEKLPEYVVTPPAAESLLTYTPGSQTFWPESIVANPERESQAEVRRELSQKLGSLFEKLPNAEVALTEAIDQGHITEKEGVELYQSFTRMLEADPLNARIALYIPFELLPHQQKLLAHSEDLQQSSKKFLEKYMRSWRSLLSQHNLRADFNDGDVPEQEYRTESLPTVVKAAHLIPKLVERGLLSVEETLELLEDTTDTVLADSIADTLSILRGMGLLNEKHLEQMDNSDSSLCRNMARILRKEDAVPHAATSETMGSVDIDSVVADIRTQLTTHQAGKRQAMTEAREKWLTKHDEEQLVSVRAEELSQALLRGVIQPDDFDARLQSSNDAVELRLITQALRDFLVENARRDLALAQSAYATYKPALEVLWKKNQDGEVHETLKSFWHHLAAVGVVTQSSLEELGVKMPNFGLSGKEILPISESETRSLDLAIKKIESNPELTKRLYPVALLLGSQVKGYAGKTADLDVAVFIRPGVPLEERAYLEELLQQTFVHEKITSTPMEFWLTERDETLIIQDFENPDSTLGDSSLVHPLLGMMRGDRKAIQELYERLLPNYLYSVGKTIIGEDARQIWLETMEHDLLQYRLMHKGYTRLFPKQGGVRSSHAEAIDGESTFYDSGYRRLATKLFVERVFLPQLEKPNA